MNHILGGSFMRNTIFILSAQEVFIYIVTYYMKRFNTSWISSIIIHKNIE